MVDVVPRRPPSRTSDFELDEKGFRHLTWRDGTRGPMFSKFCFRRVVVAHDDGTPAEDREPVWLVTEWPEGESRPTKFTLSTLPRRMSKKHIARTIKERWRTERAYEELKGELGLDHYEDHGVIVERLRSAGISIRKDDVVRVCFSIANGRRAAETDGARSRRRRGRANTH